jgi:hypothetical protein
VTDREQPGPDPIAEDVQEAYRESDLPPSVARERAADAERMAERSGQAEEEPGEDEKGAGILEK